MDKMPDNVIPIRTLQVNRQNKKHCQCYEWSTFPKKAPQFELDAQNREVTCKHCGEKVDPFDALLTMSRRWEDISQETQRLLEQAKGLDNYKPWLRAIKSIESNVRSGQMIPSCPHCHRGILLDEFEGYVSKERELQRRKFEKSANQP